MQDREVLSGYAVLTEAPSMLQQQGISPQVGAGTPQQQGPVNNPLKMQAQQNPNRVAFNQMGNYRGAQLYNVTYNGFLAGYVTFYNGTYTFIYNPKTYGNFEQAKPLYQSNFQQFNTLNNKQYQDVNKLKQDISNIGQQAVVKTTQTSVKPV